MNMESKDPTGIFTVEGNVAGIAALKFAKQREKQLASFEEQKKKFEAAKEVKNIHDVNSRFRKEIIGNNAKEHKKNVYGLKSREEFLKIKELERTNAPVDKETQIEAQRKRKMMYQEGLRKQRKMLSFDIESDEVEELEDDTDIQIKKDPSIDTSFLPDRDREELRKVETQRKNLDQVASEERVKKERFTICFSFYDGMHHEYEAEVRKDSTVGEFLKLAKSVCTSDFPELSKQTNSDLMLVKQNIILPTSLTFFELIKLRSHKGPLFHLEKVENKEKDFRDKAIACLRFWYDRNRHIFPADRWENYREDKLHQV